MRRTPDAGYPTPSNAQSVRPLGVRNSMVLHAIIEQHIATALPVGSAVVAGLPDIALSPASVRAVMAELTELGYLSQPHTSAGRLPTAKALRLYVERLARLSPLSEAERAEICLELSRQEHEIVAMLKHAATLLARRAGQVGMVLAPDKNSAHLRRITFMPAASDLVLAVLELDGGLVRTCAVHPPEPFSSDDLVRFGNFLTERYADTSLASMRDSIYRETSQAGRQLEDLCLRALGLSRLALEQLEAERELFVNGAANLFTQVEFANITRMRRLLTAIEDRSRLLDLLDATLRSEAVSITLSPDSAEGLEACAMISAPFGNDGPRGVVSLFGPLRMDYARLIPVVEGVSSALTALYAQHLTKA